MLQSKPKILAISGGISSTSYNKKILQTLKVNYTKDCEILIYDQIANFPFFTSGISDEETPEIVKDFLKEVEKADGILICSPEYVFSIPGVLKNAIEWAVSSVVFTDKPVALITAASVGEKAHESLLLVLKTIGAKLSEKTNLLITGVKGKVSVVGEIIDEPTGIAVHNLMNFFLNSLRK
ncbi:NAD(P)H-dependent oxidoreductase [Leptospira sp. 2 VSF19]|uniref:NAD(P)H-dependent oxidoreductase n=1 Tax=Leptospira soteropolitanensis TaxID=2950025 RepID=A0AAW5VGR0_9LEPT|nr:NADPH-dependent FMN reductase [Leptospira soteropolitanensis]MCW7493994.1 NAD(P)H-dependent oxidoreductase [Leptospira soteropolitanensis]MCW7501740.1 NAD(P)H-dependent oxidoreductase [Leptospira soteropolitanensis]MCW7523840.1 NAD(P)H-dependent oxidoreductase [Leptospira soteropolitanensis]MCW7527705.1 NAD(P)H-dependent oxidoreductase [Leptospira soteropolitanensis]MCW7531710.1 NAD(P)H-dependent oxidoreductase [Leptospira soteropolitanensis]